MFTSLVGNTVSYLFLFTTAIHLGNCAVRYKKCDSLDVNEKPTQGYCVEFPLCPRLLEFAKNPSKSYEDFRYLHKLTCGFNLDKPRICCPESDLYKAPLRDEDEFTKLPLLFPETETNDATAVHYSKGVGSDKLIPRLEDCGEPKQDLVTATRIFGGAPADSGQFPYMALLYRIDTLTDEEEYYCSGTIINEFYVLTAAHCILTNNDTSHKLAFVQVGITDVSERCQSNNQSECLFQRQYEVKETVVHPKYVYKSRDRSHDIALIRTARRMELNEKYIRPVCLPFTEAYQISLPFGTEATNNKNGRDGPIVGIGMVAGWGKESNIGRQQSSSKLKFVDLPVLSRAECQHRYGGQVKISDKQICAGGEYGKDTCIGDSGGPLLTALIPGNKENEKFAGKMVQTGIVSFGPAICATTGKPSVYTRVLSYIDWILSNMYV